MGTTITEAAIVGATSAATGETLTLHRPLGLMPHLRGSLTGASRQVDAELDALVLGKVTRRHRTAVRGGDQAHDVQTKTEVWRIPSFFTHGDQRIEQAILQFEEIIQKYGDHPKVASAMLKQALAFESSGDKATARLLLQRVVERFPLSDEAGKAKQKLQAAADPKAAGGSEPAVRVQLSSRALQASGFSHNTCLPAENAFNVQARCK